MDRLQIEMDLREEQLSHLRHDVLSILSGGSLSAQLIQRKGEPQSAALAERIVRSTQRITEIMAKTKSLSSKPVAA